MTTKTILIAASGSGGHLLPARYIAEALLVKAKEKRIELNIHFIGSGRPLEKKLIADFGFQLHTITIHGVASRGLKGYVEALFEYPKALVATYRLFRQINPDIVVGVGGYVSVPPVLIAWFKKIPTIIHEAEIKPGLATQLLGFFANKITAAFATNEIRQKKKIVTTGHPINPLLLEVVHGQSCPAKNILILGGSQGSKTMDYLVSKVLGQYNDRILSIQHQARHENLDSVRAMYAQSQHMAEVTSFFDDMKAAYSFADIIISRAGAGSVTEIGFLGKPSILVPLPNVGNHQLENAKSIAKENFIIVVSEGEAFEERFAEAISQLLRQSEAKEFYLDKTKPQNVEGLAQFRIADEIMKLID